MAKVTIQTIANLDNPPTAVSQLNANFVALQTVIDTLLSRDGAAPNSMLSILDMNNNRIVNLPVPISPTEPARHGDIQQYVDQAEAAADAADASADRAEAEADDAEQSADEAEAALQDLESRFLGAYAVPPTVDNYGNPLIIGALYFDTVLDQLNVYTIRDVKVVTDDVVSNGFNVVVAYWIPIPVDTYAGLSDVDVTGLVSGQITSWNGTFWVPTNLSAVNVSYDPTIIDSTNVQDAIDELLDRTSLGVYDIAFYAQGLPGSEEEIFRMVVAREFHIPVNATQSIARFRVAPASGSQVFSLRKNDVEFGTITFADDSTVGVFSVAGETTFQNGDFLSLVAPVTIDAAERDLSITLACQR